MKNLYDEFSGLMEVLSERSTSYTEEAAEGFGYLIEDMSLALAEGDKSVEGYKKLFSNLSNHLEEKSVMEDKPRRKIGYGG